MSDHSSGEGPVWSFALTGLAILLVTIMMVVSGVIGWLIGSK